MKKTTEISIYESSMIHSSNYNFTTNELKVEFKGGTVYTFPSVDVLDYQLFTNSDSVGKAFNEHIRIYGGIKQESEISTIKE